MGMSSQCIGPGASHLSKLDSNSSLPIDHHNESTHTVGNQYFCSNAITGSKHNITFHNLCELHALFFLELQSL